MVDKYPQIAHMKSNEIFIEYASLVSNMQLKIKLKPNLIIKKSEAREWERNIKAEHNCDTVYLVTISK